MLINIHRLANSLFNGQKSILHINTRRCNLLLQITRNYSLFNVKEQQDILNAGIVLTVLIVQKERCCYVNMGSLESNCKMDKKFYSMAQHL